MAPIKISIFNRSTVLKDAEVQAALPALQTQIHRDFAPVWGIDADLTFVLPGQPPGPSSWQLGIFDDSDQAGALGYHDLTQQGPPLAKVFAHTDILYKAQWTVTASHELLEMLADPDINLTAMAYAQAGPGLQWLLLYAYEVCDPCEADALGYEIGGVLVSDFVFPAWFETFWQTDGAQFDFQKKIRNPFELAAGGYSSIFDVSGGTGWGQFTADESKRAYSARAQVGSRRERRKTPRRQWLRSAL